MAKSLNRLELTLELDPLCEPISGRVTDARGQRRTFSGWLDLMDVLDGARHNIEVRPATTPAHQAESKTDRLEEPK